MNRYIISLALSLCALAPAAEAAPDLAPYAPDGWSAEIVIAKTNDTFTDSTGLTTSDDLWFSYAVANFGDTDTPTAVQNWLYVDGVQTLKFSTNTPVRAGYYSSYEHYNLGKFSAGTHTLKIVADATNAAPESNEMNNEYTKTITVSSVAGTLPNLKPVAPTGWSAAVVVSSVAGTTVDTPKLKTTDKLDVDFAFTNSGPGAVNSGSPGFRVEVLIDGVVERNFSYALAMNPGEVLEFKNGLALSLVNLAPGAHQIKLRLDADQVRAENNESDNQFSKTITVRATPDLNNDFKADIIQQNASDNKVRALLMGANGAVLGFKQPLGTAGLPAMQVVGTADLNGDGIADIVRQSTGNRAVSVTYLNNSGVATGTASLFGGTGQGDWKVAAILDLNGDAHDDILFQNASNNQVKGYTLTAAGAIIATVRPYGATALNGLRISGAGDVDGDGRADILRQATAGANKGRITASIVTGNGSVTRTTQMLGGVAPGTMKLVGTTDLNRDGIEDLVLEDPSNGSLEGEIMNNTGNSVSTLGLGGGTAYGPWKVKG